MKFLKSWVDRARSIPWLAEGAAVLGLVLYGVQSFVYSHQIESTIDEGNYLYKGYLFATGVYRPFQPYGPWTNKMPLSFLIPGWVEAVFGPGIRTGRYFAIFLGLLILAGVWLACLRLGGRWWAAAGVLAIAINPILIKEYSQALSEGLIACLLVWSLALVLGSKRTLGELCLAAALAGLVVDTRQNMLPLVPFIVLYIIWEYGWRKGMISAAFALLPLIVVHVIYWPGILQIWLPYLPQKLTPFLDSFRAQVGNPNAWDLSSTSFSSRLFVFWEGIRQNFVSMIGALCAWIFWPKKSEWKSASHFKAAVFLSALLIVLALAHAWASLNDDYCVYCFNIYLSFFCETGILLVAASFSSWTRKPGIFRQLLAGLAILVAVTGIAYGAHEEVDTALLSITIPRFHGLQILPGTTQLWRMLSNKYGTSYDLLKQLVPTAAGTLIGILILIAALVYFLAAHRKGRGIAPGYSALVGFFLLGILLTPSVVLGGGNADPNCGDILAAYESSGKQLAGQIPPGSLVYWEGGLSPAPLLYVPGVRIFPPQLNDGYALRQGGDADVLYRNGYWNQELSTKWISQADFVLLEGKYSKQPIYNQLSTDGYDQLKPTQQILTCRSDSQILIFRRKP
ncbi:MAG: hypothetical protein P4L50_17190 [Anaerolineaceae bacterium]|nr:hypothetical protein [Anaerolineaceae bacterium]